MKRTPAEKCSGCGKTLSEAGGRRIIATSFLRASIVQTDKAIRGVIDAPTLVIPLADRYCQLALLLVGTWSPEAIERARADAQAGFRPWICQRAPVEPARRAGIRSASRSSRILSRMTGRRSTRPSSPAIRSARTRTARTTRRRRVERGCYPTPCASWSVLRAWAVVRASNASGKRRTISSRLSLPFFRSLMPWHLFSERTHRPMASSRVLAPWLGALFSGAAACGPMTFSVCLMQRLKRISIFLWLIVGPPTPASPSIDLSADEALVDPVDRRPHGYTLAGRHHPVRPQAALRPDDLRRPLEACGASSCMIR